MKEKTTTKTAPAKETLSARSAASFFGQGNFLWMIIGAAVMILGFLLMAGGRSTDPRVFNPDEIYSTTRITIAPILILIGLIIEVFAIFRNPKKS